ncbi:MAG: hypothetical protein OHK005_17620 [Candidatus Methylacidiphilales bacterium]
MPKPSVTIYDVARAAHVSPAAVSLALRGEGTLAASTRNKILRIAEQLGYQRNVFAASLRLRQPDGSTPHGPPLAVLLAQSARGEVYPVSPLREGLRQETHRLGYTLTEVTVSHRESLRAILRTLYYQGVQGIFIPHLIDPGLATPKDWSHFCVVACHLGRHPPVFHTVRASAFDSVFFALQELTHRGYRRVGAAIFQHDPRSMDDITREAALHLGLQEFGLTALAPFLGSHQDLPGFLTWFNAQKPEAVLAFHVGCYYWLRKIGVDVPGKVGFCSLHLEDVEAARSLTGFHSPEVDMGRAAVQQMDTMIRHRERGLVPEPKEILLRRTWCEGTTLPPRTPSPPRRPAPVRRRSTSQPLSRTG